MEMTYEQWREMKKALRRSFSSIGWILLAYYGIMNVAVFLTVFVETIVQMITNLSTGNFNALMEFAESAGNNAWGYFLAAGIGILILLLWKKPRFWKEEIWAKGEPMKFGSFLGLLCVFLSVQMVYQISAIVLELIMNIFGLSIMEGLNQMAMDTDSISMFLYAGILAPITEEILFRGLIQRTLMPYGRRFAIFCSAFTFGIFHGSLLQSPYAFLVGLVLGYVASRYSIAWAMLLHMINNLLIADILNRLTSGLPETMAGLIVWAVIALFSVAAVVILIVKRREIRAWRRSDRIHRVYLGCFFSSPGMIILMALMGLSIIFSFVMMIGPL